MKVAEKDVLVHCHHVTCSYGDSAVVSDVNFTLRRGEFAGIVGPSGSGKTTLLKAVLGSIKPVHGSIDMLKGLRMGYVPQVESVDWNFPVTVLEVMMMTRSEKKWWPRITTAERTAAEDVLERLGLGGLGGRHIRELSGGQQQRLCIARSLAVNPQVLLMDEPCSALDPGSTLRIEETIRELASSISIVIVTHNMQQAARVSDYTGFFLSDGGPGRLIESSSTSEIFTNPKEKRTEDYVSGRFG